MANSVTYEWSEAKGAFAVSLNGEVITYTATEEAAEDYIGRLAGGRSGDKRAPAAKQKEA